MKDAVIVSYATYAREDYPKAQDRLIYNFIDSGWDGKFLMFSDRPRMHERGIEIFGLDHFLRKQNEVPYAFKPDSMYCAREVGFKKIMWADSTILMLRNFDELWNVATVQGVVAFHNLGHPLHKYISDQAAAKLGILNREDFEVIPQIMACAILFDLDNSEGLSIFQEWRDASYVPGLFENGKSTRHDFRAHRHDQAILSAILFQHQIPLLKYGDLVYEPHDITKEYGDPYLVNSGIK